MQLRHGDVILRQIAALPKDAKEVAREAIVLAEGEATGHAHRISEGAAALFGFDEKRYLSVQSDLALLTHEEHHTLKVPNGVYEIVIQREYEPRGWRNVVD